MLAPLLILSWKFIFGRQISAPYLRTFGFFLLLASLAAGLQLLPISLPDVNFMPGGVTGVLIVDTLLPNLNKTGTVIVVAGALILGILASTTLSLEKIFTRIAKRPSMPRPAPLGAFPGVAPRSQAGSHRRQHQTCSHLRLWI